MADPSTTDEMTDEELHERLARLGHPVTVKGKMTEAQRQIQRKKLNHLEAKERTEREKAEKQAAKRAREEGEGTGRGAGSSGPANKRAKNGARRRTMASVASSATEDEYLDVGVGIERVDQRPPLKSLLDHRETIALNKDSSPLIIHVIDTFLGQAAAAVPVKLSVFHATKDWFQLAERRTSSDGECPGLITKDLFQSGFYRIRFNTEEYYKLHNMNTDFPEIEVAIHVKEPGEKFTVSVLLMSTGYTTTVVKNTKA